MAQLKRQSFVVFQHPRDKMTPAVTVDDPWPVDFFRLLGYASLALGFLGATLKGLYSFIIIIIIIIWIPSSRLA